MVPHSVNKINLLIVDDHRMVRDGLRVMLESLSGKDGMTYNISEAESGEEALRQIKNHAFDVVLIDYQMPGMDGAQTAENMLLYKPGLKIIALSNYAELAYVEHIIAVGAKGYLLKNIEPFQLLKAIKTVLSGNIYYSNEIAVRLLDADRKGPDKIMYDGQSLTKREVQVLRMIAAEMTNEEIAAKLFVGKRTIDTHRQNLLNKLNARNTAGLVKAAIKLNLVK